MLKLKQENNKTMKKSTLMIQEETVKKHDNEL